MRDRIIVLNVQLSFHGLSKYSSGMLEKLCKEARIHTELPTSHCYILKAHIVELCYAISSLHKQLFSKLKIKLQTSKISSLSALESICLQ